MKQQITLEYLDLLEVITTYFRQKYNIEPAGDITIVQDAKKGAPPVEYALTFEARTVETPTTCPLCDRVEYSKIVTSGFAQVDTGFQRLPGSGVVPLTVGVQPPPSVTAGQAYDAPAGVITSVSTTTANDDVDADAADDQGGLDPIVLASLRAQSSQLIREKKAKEKSFTLMPGESLSPPRPR